MAKIKREMASYMDKKHMDELLTEHLCSIEGSEFFEYKNGWDDSRIAREANQRLSPASAASLRRTLFGELRKSNPHASAQRLSKRVIDLECQLRRFMNMTLDANDVAFVLGDADNNTETARK